MSWMQADAVMKVERVFFRSKRVIFCVAIVATFSGIRAETVVVPNIYGSGPAVGPGLSFPFDQPGARWQQTYMSSEFSAASGNVIQIDEIRFRIDESTALGSAFSTVVPGLNIFMSTTTRTFDSASAAFSQNGDGNLFQVLPSTDFPLSGSRSSATSFDVVIPLPNKFDYDRSAGNLLVDIRVPQGSGLPFLDQQIGVQGATFGIGGSIAAPNGTKTMQGLITRFEYSVVPEPKPIFLMIPAALALIIVRGSSRSIHQRP